MAIRAAQLFKEKLQTVAGGHVLEVRVFGSMARGNEHAGSDLDLFVMVDAFDFDLERRIVRCGWQVLDELDLPFVISPFIVTRAHFEELIGLEQRIARDILTEGVHV